MIRRVSLVVLAASLAAVALTGCSTFTDNDVVAEVGDEQLTEADVRSILGDSVDDTTEVPYSVANTIVTNWIIDRVLRADLAAGGEPLDEVGGELSAETQEASFDAAFSTWQQTEPTTVTDRQVASAYGEGPIESGMVCVSHILVDDASTANEVVDQLDDGEAFADLAVEYSTDPGSAAEGGVLPCSSLSAFAGTYIPEFVDAVVDAESGDVVGPVETQFGYHVIWIRPFDDLTEADIDTLLADGLVRFSFAADAAGIDVDPRFGEFDIASGLVPVG